MTPDPILSPELPARPDPLRAAITAAWVRDEAEHVRELLVDARQPDADRAAIEAQLATIIAGAGFDTLADFLTTDDLTLSDLPASAPEVGQPRGARRLCHRAL